MAGPRAEHARVIEGLNNPARTFRQCTARKLDRRHARPMRCAHQAARHSAVRATTDNSNQEPLALLIRSSCGSSTAHTALSAGRALESTRRRRVCRFSATACTTDHATTLGHGSGSSTVVVQHPACRSFYTWNRAQILVDCTNIALLHTLIDGPGHDLQQIAVKWLHGWKAVGRYSCRTVRMKVVQVRARADDLQELRK